MLYQPVVTGLGVVSPIGVGVEPFWTNAVEGRSGVGLVTQFDGSTLPPHCRIVAEVSDFRPNDWMGGMFGKMAGRFSHFAVAATRMALMDSGLDEAQIPPERLKVCFASSMSGLVDLHENGFRAFLRGEKVVPWTILEYSAHAATSHVVGEAGARSHTASFATACCAAIDAIAWAADQVRLGNAVAVVAGATETPLSCYSLTAFDASKTLSTWDGAPQRASRPFDRRRCGIVLAEGAGTVIIEDELSARKRGAPIYARVLGFGSASEGGELRSVDESGSATAEAMRVAINKAGLSPCDIDYICAHGNSMVNYDAAETAGIKLVFGRNAWNIPVSSIKSMCGHALGAAGAIQTVTTCLTLRHQTITPTINYEEPDPACDLDYVPNLARRARVRTALIHSHSIGGTHMALVLSVPN